MNYANIKYFDIANGPGVRSSLFVSGCTHHCRGCFNPETWDFSYGEPFGPAAQEELLESLDAEYVSGLTLLGGEPMEPDNQRALLPFIRKMKTRYPAKDIWCYTGYTFDTDLQKGGAAFCKSTDELISYFDVIVDGEYSEELHDITLKFRGSSNQRIIHLDDAQPNDTKIALAKL